MVKRESARRFLSTPKVDVIIVGAGIAGLTTAMKLLQKESALQIKILEASNAVGGQLCETFLGEIGSKWITVEQYHIWQLLDQLKVPTAKRIILAPELKRCWDLDSGIWAPFAKFELKRYINAIDLRLCDYQMADRRKKETLSTKTAQAEETTNIVTMYKHIYANLFFRQSREFMISLVQYVSGTVSEHIDFTEFMYICSSHGSLRQLIQLYIECPNDLFEISSDKLVHALLDRLQPAELLLWRQVMEVHQHRDYVEVRDSAFELHTATVLVLAVPWESLNNMIVRPEPPFELHQRCSLPLSLHRHRLMVTCMLARYTEAHWRNAGYSGSFMCNSMPPLSLLIGYEYRPAVYAAQLLHTDSVGAWLQPLAFQLLAKHFGSGMLLPKDYSERTFTLPSLACSSQTFTIPWHRVVFAHSATAATCCRGSISGAVQSAQQAAVNVLLLLRPQNLNWQDIAEIQGTIFDTSVPTPVNWLQRWLSSLNLYNVSWYSLLAIGILIGIHFTSKRIALNLR